MTKSMTVYVNIEVLTTLLLNPSPVIVPTERLNFFFIIDTRKTFCTPDARPTDTNMRHTNAVGDIFCRRLLHVLD